MALGYVGSHLYAYPRDLKHSITIEAFILLKYFVVEKAQYGITTR
jgi:hypothetical protein